MASNALVQTLLNRHLSRLYISVIFVLGLDIPPLREKVLIKQLSGRILAGEVGTIYNNNSMLRLDKVSIVEVIGLKQGLEPIYSFKRKSIKYAFIKTEDIIHWEKLPDYLKLDPE